MAVHGRYTIVGKLADGGMAEIFLGAQHGAEGFEKAVVLKRIHTAFSADPQFRNMFIDEAHISMTLSHGNIVQVLDLGVSNGRYFLVLELVDGWDLHQILKRARAAQMAWPPALALYVAAQLCRALAFAHAKTQNGRALGIVHRDISPNNVLLSEQGEVKLADFGIAKAQRKREQTAAGVIKGKVAFMSPEQATGAAIDWRSDLFSVGTVLYLMTTDKQPFEGANDLETLAHVQRAEFSPPDKVKPDLAPALVRVITRAMRLPVGERYQTADEMQADIERVLRTEYHSAGQTELKQWLAQLARKDDAPTISKRVGDGTAAAAASDGGTDLNAGTSFELGDLDIAASMTEVAPTPPPMPAPVPPPLPAAAGAAAAAAREAVPDSTYIDDSRARSKGKKPRRMGGFWLGVTAAIAAVIGLRYFGEWASRQGWFGPSTISDGQAPTSPPPPTMEPVPSEKSAAKPAGPGQPTPAPTTTPTSTTTPPTPAAGSAAAAADAAAAARPAVTNERPMVTERTDAAPGAAADGGNKAHPTAAEEPGSDDSDDDSDEETLLRKADPNAAKAVIGEDEATPVPAPPAKKGSTAAATPSGGAAGKNKKAEAPAGGGKTASPPTTTTTTKPAPPYVTVSLHITSSPDGAVVRIHRRVLGRTPINLRFKTDNSYELTFVKDGYTPTTKRVAVKGRNDGRLAVSLKKKPSTNPLRSLFHPHR
ncbi:MAG: eukaryotic-like serine/threonine-protein kinase [Myxococcales bacterium]|jgi:serine/threonine-protein kinase|nr:eukaryotic-like serine/threonine-protein kinase [Myxococcales bacterium]